MVLNKSIEATEKYLWINKKYIENFIAKIDRDDIFKSHESTN